MTKFEISVKIDGNETFNWGGNIDEQYSKLMKDTIEYWTTLYKK